MSGKLKWTILVGIFVIVAIVALLVGFKLAGVDIVGWFTSKWAFIVYFGVGSYLVFVGYVIVDEIAHR